MDRDIPLKNIALFADYCTDSELKRIQDEVPLVRFPAGYNLYQNDNELDNVFVVLRGSVMIYDIRGTVKRIYTIIESGDLFGENALIGKRKYSLSADTREESEIFLFPKNVFLRILETKPQIKERMKQIIIGRLKSQKDILEAEMDRAKKFELRSPVFAPERVG